MRCSSSAAGVSANSSGTATTAGADSRSRRAATVSAIADRTLARAVASRAAVTALAERRSAPVTVSYPATCRAARPPSYQGACAAPYPNRLIAKARTANVHAPAVTVGPPFSAESRTQAAMPISTTASSTTTALVARPRDRLPPLRVGAGCCARCGTLRSPTSIGSPHSLTADRPDTRGLFAIHPHGGWARQPKLQNAAVLMPCVSESVDPEA